MVEGQLNSPPLTAPGPWVFWRGTGADHVVIWTRSGFEARQRAPIAFFDSFGERCEAPVLVGNPCTDPTGEAFEAHQRRLGRVRFYMRATCREVDAEG